MKSGFQLKSSRLLVVLLAIWPCIVFAAQPTNAPASLDYSAFKIIPDRNIFNTRRSARYTATTSERGPSRRAARTESFALVGTMNYAEQGPLAFFEGSRSEYKKALKPEEAIAGFKLASIQPNAVKLASPSNEIELKVGMQLRREDEGEWRASSMPETFETAAARSTSGSSSSQRRANGGASEVVSEAGQASATDDAANRPGASDLGAQPALTNATVTGASSGPDNDVLERLRRRREQENNP